MDAAVKLYRGLWVSFSNHPQINAELGLLMLKHRTPKDAVPCLNRAVSALPTAFEPWVCLVIAHQRCGDLGHAREVLAQMHAQEFASKQLPILKALQIA